MNASLRILAPVVIGATLSLAFAGASIAADAKTGCRTSDPMRNSVMRKADEGVDALRRYVWITRAIHQLDMNTVADSIDAWRAEAGCPARVGVAGEALPTVALKSGD